MTYTCGKGDRYRPTDPKKWAKGYERVFGDTKEKQMLTEMEVLADDTASDLIGFIYDGEKWHIPVDSKLLEREFAVYLANLFSTGFHQEKKQ